MRRDKTMSCFKVTTSMLPCKAVLDSLILTFYSQGRNCVIVREGVHFFPGVGRAGCTSSRACSGRGSAGRRRLPEPERFSVITRLSTIASRGADTRNGRLLPS